MSEPSGGATSNGARAVRYVFALVLLGFGLTFGYGGLNVIRRGSYDLPWRSQTELGLGPLAMSRESSGIEHYRDGEATRMGAGLTSFGAMLTLWGVGLFFPQGRPWGTRHNLISIASLLFVLTTVVLIFPPWRILSQPGPLGFYLSLALAGGVAATSSKYGHWVCMAILAASILLDDRWRGLALGSGLGLLASLILAGHVALLVPRFRRHVMPAPPAAL